MEFKIIFETTVTNCGFKENCKTTTRDCGFKDIFGNFKTTITNGGFSTFKKKKFHMDSYMDRKDYFDKYFGRSTILTIFFFFKRIILDLKLPFVRTPYCKDNA